MLKAIAANAALLRDAGWLFPVVRELIQCDGLAVTLGGQVFTGGATPPRPAIESLAILLDELSPGDVFVHQQFKSAAAGRLSSSRCCGGGLVHSDLPQSRGLPHSVSTRAVTRHPVGGEPRQSGARHRRPGTSVATKKLCRVCRVGSRSISTIQRGGAASGRRHPYRTN